MAEHPTHPHPDPPRVLLIFIDGLGVSMLRRSGPESAAGSALGILRIDGAVAVPGFAAGPSVPTLGVDGLPQSATGRPLFTGVNAAALAAATSTDFPTGSCAACWSGRACS